MSAPGGDDVVLQPGDYFVGTGTRVRTLLGSCVSITLWHPRRRIGAMSHFLLWSRGGLNEPPTGRTQHPLDARYGADVLPLMLQGLAQWGVRAEECEGKLFGGGSMFPAQALSTGRPGIGRHNGSQARHLLQHHGITPVSQSLYGVGHRLIVFDLQSGEVWVKQVEPASAGANPWSDLT